MAGLLVIPQIVKLVQVCHLHVQDRGMGGPPCG